MTQPWNGTLTGSGPSYMVRDVSWDGSIGANDTITFGFVGGGTAAMPTLTCTSP